MDRIMSQHVLKARRCPGVTSTRTWASNCARLETPSQSLRDAVVPTEHQPTLAEHCFEAPPGIRPKRSNVQNSLQRTLTRTCVDFWKDLGQEDLPLLLNLLLTDLCFPTLGERPADSTVRMAEPWSHSLVEVNRAAIAHRGHVGMEESGVFVGTDSTRIGYASARRTGQEQPDTSRHPCSPDRTRPSGGANASQMPRDHDRKFPAADCCAPRILESRRQGGDRSDVKETESRPTTLQGGRKHSAPSTATASPERATKWTIGGWRLEGKTRETWRPSLKLYARTSTRRNRPTPRRCARVCSDQS